MAEDTQPSTFAIYYPDEQVTVQVNLPTGHYSAIIPAEVSYHEERRNGEFEGSIFRYVAVNHLVRAVGHTEQEARREFAQAYSDFIKREAVLPITVVYRIHGENTNKEDINAVELQWWDTTRLLHRVRDLSHEERLTILEEFSRLLKEADSSLNVPLDSILTKS